MGPLPSPVSIPTTTHHHPPHTQQQPHMHSVHPGGPHPGGPPGPPPGHGVGGGPPHGMHPVHPGGPPPGPPGGPHHGPPHHGPPPHHGMPPGHPGGPPPSGPHHPPPGHSPHGPPPPHGPPHPHHPGHMHMYNQLPPPPHHGMPPHGMAHLPPDGRPGPMMDHHPGRRTPYFGSPDFRIYEMNKRLQQRTDDSDNLWWDSFATEFFEDDATLTLTFSLEDGPKRYTIGRTLIPRYFRSIFDGGVTDLSFQLKHPKESFHNTIITLDCDQCSIVTTHGKHSFLKTNQYDPMMKDGAAVVVCTDGRLIVEFTFDDLMRVKSWHFSTRQHQELIPRSVVALNAQQDPSMLEQMSKNITRQGLTNATLNYLRLCVILEPMQELMSRHKAYSLSPRDCLKTTLFQKWQRMIAPPEAAKPPSKRRKRKSSATNSGPNVTGTKMGKKKGGNNSVSPGPPNFSLASQDVMVVGEPSLMGGEFGDEDERLITRLENNQYDPTAAGPPNGLDDSEDAFGGPHGPPPPTSGPPGSWGPPPLPPVSQTPTTSSIPTTLPPDTSRSGGPIVPVSANGSSEDKKPSPLNK